MRPGVSGMAGEAPVPISTRSARSLRSLPPGSFTIRALPMVKCADPRKSVILGFDARMLSYLACRSSSTRPCCWAKSAERSRTATRFLMPSKGWSDCRCARCAARIMILEGTQPTLTQVPPRVPRSMSVTLAPSSAARMAQANAAPPLPMIATSSAPRELRRGFTEGVGVSTTEMCGRSETPFATVEPLRSSTSASKPLPWTVSMSFALSTPTSVLMRAVPSSYETLASTTPATPARASSIDFAQ